MEEKEEKWPSDELTVPWKTASVQSQEYLVHCAKFQVNRHRADEPMVHILVAPDEYQK
jgi:hypothetical protein